MVGKERQWGRDSGKGTGGRGQVGNTESWYESAVQSKGQVLWEKVKATNPESLRWPERGRGQSLRDGMIEKGRTEEEYE